MWLKHIEIVNVGPFERFETGLVRGSVGVFGANGAGKSSLLRCLYVLLTDDWSRFAPKKADAVRQDAPRRAAAHVAGVVVAADGREVTLRRGLQPDVQELVAGGVRVSGRDAVNRELEALLGVGRDLLGRFAFIEQDRVLAFLTDTDARRKDAFQALCGTRACERVHELLGAWLNHDPELLAAPADNAADLEAELADCAAEAARLDEAQARHAARSLNPRSGASARKILQRVERRQGLVQERARLAAALAADEAGQPPPGPPAAADLDALKARRQELTAVYAAAGQQLSTFGHSGQALCPTCKQPVAGLDLTPYRLTVAIAPAQLKALTAAIEQAERQAAAAARRAQWQAARAVRQQRLAELDAELAETDEPPGRVDKARRRLAEDEAARRELARLEGARSALEARRRRAGAALEALRGRRRRCRRLQALADVVRDVRAAFHRDGVPLEVARANLGAVEAGINRGLRDFGAPLRVEADDQLRFVVTRPGRPPQPAAQLSTGQKVVLAVAFWDAVGALWCGGSGLLALDEPTAHLDDANRRHLAAALPRLSTGPGGRRQLFLVTLDDALRGAFDQVIDLGGSRGTESAG